MRCWCSTWWNSQSMDHETILIGDRYIVNKSYLFIQGTYIFYFYLYIRISRRQNAASHERDSRESTECRNSKRALLRDDSQGGFTTSGEYGWRARQDSRWTFVTIRTTARFGTIIVVQVKENRTRSAVQPKWADPLAFDCSSQSKGGLFYIFLSSP